MMRKPITTMSLLVIAAMAAMQSCGSKSTPSAEADDTQPQQESQVQSDTIVSDYTDVMDM